MVLTGGVRIFPRMTDSADKMESASGGFVYFGKYIKDRGGGW